MIVIQIFKIAWQLYCYGRQKGEAWLMGLGAGLLGSQLALLLHRLVDAVLWGIVRPAPIVWGVWGITIAAWQVVGSTNSWQGKITRRLSRRWRVIKRSTNRFDSAHRMTTVNQLTQSKRIN
jgi:hypothetical protein